MPRNSLTIDDAIKIRELHKKGMTGAELARIYKVTEGAISRIVNGKTRRA